MLPAVAAKWGASLHRAPQRFDFRIGLRSIHVIDPIFGHRNRPFAQSARGIRSIAAKPQTRPRPRFRLLHEQISVGDADRPSDVGDFNRTRPDHDQDPLDVYAKRAKVCSAQDSNLRVGQSSR